MPREVRILEEREGAGIARGIVGQHLYAWIDLKDVEPVAAKSVVERILFDARELWVNGHDFEPILGALLIRGRCRKRDAHKRRIHEPPRIVVEPGITLAAGDTQGPHVRHVQQAGQAHLLLARLHQAEQRGVISLLIEFERKRRGIRADHVIRTQSQHFFAACDLPDRLALELVGLANKCEAHHGIGLGQDGVPVQLAAPSNPQRTQKTPERLVTGRWRDAGIERSHRRHAVPPEAPATRRSGRGGVAYRSLWYFPLPSAVAVTVWGYRSLTRIRMVRISLYR